MALTLVWKELREQWTAWLFLLLTTVAGYAGLAGLVSPGRSRDEMLTCLLWFTAWAYGVICGALLFANENEDGTQDFLDILPISRRRLWRSKVGTGLALLATQLLILAVITALYTPFRQATTLARFELSGIVLFGGIGYAWGLYCGAFAPNVMGAIGRAFGYFLLSAVVVPFVAVFLVEIFASQFLQGLDFTSLWIGYIAVLALAVAARSRSLYCHTDLSRRLVAAPPKRLVARQSWVVAFWLAARQCGWFALGMALVALFAVAVMAVMRIVAWPLATLQIGILCGATAFVDEQLTGAFRFAGDQRLPTGRLWLAKVAVRFAVLVGATSLAGLGAALLFYAHSATAPRQELQDLEASVRFTILGSLFDQLSIFLALWPLYGFAVGLVSGLLFRKPLVSVGVAVCVALPLTLLWVPTQIVGGAVHGWQVWCLPAVLVVASVGLVRPAATGRLFSRRVAVVTTGALAAAGICTAVGLWYRAYEIPEAPDAVNLDEYVASLPTVEENEAGRAVLAGLRRLTDLEQKFVSDDQKQQALALPGEDEPLPGVSSFFENFNRVERCTYLGWDPLDKKCARFLDQVFADPWAARLAEAVGKPTGVAMDPRGTTIFTRLPELSSARRAVDLLIASGLRKQYEGDPAAFLDGLDTSLTVGRNIKNRSFLIAVIVGAGVESEADRGVEKWLEGLNGRPDLLRRALAILQRQQSESTVDFEDARKAQLLGGVNAFAELRDLPQTASRSEAVVLGSLATPDVLRFALEVPWEKVRFRRLLDSLYSENSASGELAERLAPAIVRFQIQPFSKSKFVDPEYFWPHALAHSRAALLQVALRLYQAEEGKTAERLTDLVPKYLPSVPLDPYDNQPFRYRVSSGEKLAWPPLRFQSDPPTPGDTASASTLKVQAGQGILWSVGADKIDNGGHRQEIPFTAMSQKGTDAIFVVPLPPKRS